MRKSQYLVAVLLREIPLPVVETARTRSLDLDDGGVASTSSPSLFIVLGVQVTNVTAREEFAVPYRHFTALTVGNTELQAHEASALVTGGCSGDETLGEDSEDAECVDGEPA